MQGGIDRISWHHAKKTEPKRREKSEQKKKMMYRPLSEKYTHFLK